MSEKLLDALTDQLDQVTERNRQLEEMLAPTSVWIDPAWQLSPSEARVFAHLVSRPVCTKESVMMALYSGRAGDLPNEKVVDVFICKLRKRLKPFGIAIATVWGQGFTVEGRERFSPNRSGLRWHLTLAIEKLEADDTESALTILRELCANLNTVTA